MFDSGTLLYYSPSELSRPERYWHARRYFCARRRRHEQRLRRQDTKCTARRQRLRRCVSVALARARHRELAAAAACGKIDGREGPVERRRCRTSRSRKEEIASSRNDVGEIAADKPYSFM